MSFTTTKDELAPFLETILQDISEELELWQTPREVSQRILEAVQSNVTKGKAFRLRAVPESARLLLGRPCKKDEFEALAKLGWIIELIQAYLLITDDIMDGSTTRRGEPCWYLRPHIGMLAINDACLLKSIAFALCKRYFRSHPHYVDLVELFHEALLVTEIGQEADVVASKDRDPVIWTSEQFTKIASLKSGYYCFYLPVATALHYLGLGSRQNLDLAWKILRPLGVSYQIQNDFNDIFSSDGKSTGKVGTDIVENKCSWIIIAALSECNAEQRFLLRQSYGNSEPDSVAQVHRIIEMLSLDQIYKKEMTARFATMVDQISQMDETQANLKKVFEVVGSCVFGQDREPQLYT